jgi:hypothetical protein
MPAYPAAPASPAGPDACEDVPVQRRGPILLMAAAVGGVFLAGLFISGPVGGILLLVTAAVLISLTSATWPRLRGRDRAIRVVVVAAILVLAVVKLVS